MEKVHACKPIETMDCAAADGKTNLHLVLSKAKMNTAH